MWEDVGLVADAVTKTTGTVATQLQHNNVAGDSAHAVGGDGAAAVTAGVAVDAASDAAGAVGAPLAVATPRVSVQHPVVPLSNADVSAP